MDMLACKAYIFPKMMVYNKCINGLHNKEAFDIQDIPRSNIGRCSETQKRLQSLKKLMFAFL